MDNSNTSTDFKQSSIEEALALIKGCPVVWLHHPLMGFLKLKSKQTLKQKLIDLEGRGVRFTIDCSVDDVGLWVSINEVKSCQA